MVSGASFGNWNLDSWYIRMKIRYSYNSVPRIKIRKDCTGSFMDGVTWLCKNCRGGCRKRERERGYTGTRLPYTGSIEYRRHPMEWMAEDDFPFLNPSTIVMHFHRHWRLGSHHSSSPLMESLATFSHLQLGPSYPNVPIDQTRTYSLNEYEEVSYMITVSPKYGVLQQVFPTSRDTRQVDKAGMRGNQNKSVTAPWLASLRHISTSLWGPVYCRARRWPSLAGRLRKNC